MALLYKLDAAVLSSMWADDAKTVQASDGSVVAVWSPSVAGSITTDAIQTSNTKRPLYRANYNSSGYAALEFDGVNDILEVSHSSAWNVSPELTLVVVARLRQATGDHLVVQKWESANWSPGWGMVLSGGRQAGGVGSWQPSGPVYSALPSIMTLRRSANYDGGSWNGYWRGAAGSGLTIAATSSYKFSIGGGTAGYYTQMGVHHIAVYDTCLDSATLDDLLYSLDQTWGVGSFNARAAGGGIMSARGFNGGIAG